MSATDKERRRALLSEYSSRRNKIWMAIGWKHCGMYLDWRYQGAEDDSRMEFQFEPDGPWVQAKSYEDDIKPNLIFNRPPKAKTAEY